LASIPTAESAAWASFTARLKALSMTLEKYERRFSSPPEYT
jgi:hypothetical protein